MRILPISFLDPIGMPTSVVFTLTEGYQCFTFLGDVLRWEQQIRLRHMLTRQYLCIDSRSEVSLCPDPSDPRTVFRLHSVLKVGQVEFDSLHGTIAEAPSLCPSL